MNRLSFHLAAAAIAATAFPPHSGGALVNPGVPADTICFAGNPDAFDTLPAIGGDAFPAPRQQSDTASVHPGVPEPPCWLLIVGGAGLLAFSRRRTIQ